MRRLFFLGIWVVSLVLMFQCVLYFSSPRTGEATTLFVWIVTGVGIIFLLAVLWSESSAVDEPPRTLLDRFIGIGRSVARAGTLAGAFDRLGYALPAHVRTRVYRPAKHELLMQYYRRAARHDEWSSVRRVLQIIYAVRIGLVLLQSVAQLRHDLRLPLIGRGS